MAHFLFFSDSDEGAETHTPHPYYQDNNTIQILASGLEEIFSSISTSEIPEALNILKQQHQELLQSPNSSQGNSEEYLQTINNYNYDLTKIQINHLLSITNNWPTTSTLINQPELQNDSHNNRKISFSSDISSIE